ncbi:unnamed protein product, partial [marine sediment metagenome]
RSRFVAEQMVNKDFILNIEFDDLDNQIVFKTNHRDQFFDTFMEIVVTHNIEIEEMISPDDNLQAVFDYLIER